MARLLALFAAVSLSASALVIACSSSSSTGATGTGTDAATDDATTSDDGSVSTDDGSSTTGDAIGPTDAAADVDKAATCAATFGNALTPGFARLDGTVVAVVPPKNPVCAGMNATHLVIQVMMGGAVYRMVVDVLSNQVPVDVYFDELDAPLGAPAWSDGWHTGVALDYPSTLSVNAAAFTAMKEDALVAKITSEIELGAKISVYATAGSTEPDSAHLVHRNDTPANTDGAIVIGPDTAKPHYMLMRFNEQDF